MRSTARRLCRVASTVAMVGLSVGFGAQVASAANTNATATTGVNIRSGPSTHYRVVGGLVRGQRITATSKSHGWVKVRFDGTFAYIADDYLNTSGKNAPAAPQRISTGHLKIATETLNVRTGPSRGYRVVGSIREGSHVTLAGKQSKGFAEIRYGGHLRWVSVQYLANSGLAAGRAPVSSAPKAGSKGQTALAFARRQLGKPYSWGASGPRSFDCSGLSMMSWRAAGVNIARTAREQLRTGHRIAKADLRPGDLVFFYGPPARHVGLYVGNGRIINAPRPGKVVQYTTISSMPYVGAVRPG